MQAHSDGVIRFAMVDADADTRLLVGLATDLHQGYDLVAEFSSVEDAACGLLDAAVDVVLVQASLADTGDLLGITRLRASVGAARIVLVAGDVGGTLRAMAIAAGADAFMERDALADVTAALGTATGRLHAAA